MNQNQHRVQCGVWVLAALLLIVAMLVPASKGQDSRGQRISKQANATRRIALVIGNGAYKEAPLKNPVNDARDMAAALREMDFEVTELHDQNFEEMETAIQAFGQRLSDRGVGLFYFAGHGVQTKDNQNYLIPVGGTITAENVKYRAVNVGELTEQMQAAQNGINLIILDACRNNPWRSLRSGARGLAAMDAPKGTLIAYATAPGSEAADGTEGNGLYTKELLAAMRSPGVKVEDVFKQVRVAVYAKSGGQQTPWELSSLTDNFYFVKESKEADPVSVVVKPKPQMEVETEIPLGTLVISVNQAGVKVVVAGQEIGTSSAAGQRFRTRNVEAGRVEVIGRRGGKEVRKTVEVIGGQETPVELKLEDELAKTYRNSIGMEFVLIPAGTFMMGSTAEEIKAANKAYGWDWASQETRHEVRISEGFYLGKYEVTQGEWEAIMGSNPSNFKGNARLPVENVSWEDTQEFIRKLNEREGREVYRLPSEAEWEYACRAGTRSEFGYGSTITAEQVNYNGNYPYGGAAKGKYRERTTEVGSFGANGWGLYDMHGNVYEWCEDWYEEKYYQTSPSVDPKGPSGGSNRVVRGGSWNNLHAVYCRSANRGNNDPGGRYNHLGFRLLRIADR